MNTLSTADDQPHAAAVSIVLALTAGYVDTVGFVALFGLFMAHVTGNFVLIGSELAVPTHGVLIKFLAFPAFIIAVATARVLVVRAEHSGRNAALQLFAVQGVLLIAFMVTGWYALPLEDSRSPLALTAGVLGAAAMGTQNAASRLVWSSVAPTTVMTGNVTQLVIDLVDLARDRCNSGLRSQVYKFLWPVLAFGAGAICGAFAFRYLSFLALAFPIGLVGILMLGSIQGKA
jgi:uncharacterized membrane protein YoaK (UPF0700 family)